MGNVCGCVWEILHGKGGSSVGESVQGMFRKLSRLGVHIPLQDYESLHAAVMICATRVNTQTHTRTDQQTAFDRLRTVRSGS